MERGLAIGEQRIVTPTTIPRGRPCHLNFTKKAQLARAKTKVIKYRPAAAIIQLYRIPIHVIKPAAEIDPGEYNCEQRTHKQWSRLLAATMAA